MSSQTCQHAPGASSARVICSCGPTHRITCPSRIIAVGDIVQLVCPVPCEELGPLARGEVVYAYPGGLVFQVRFKGGRIATVCRIELTDH